MSGPWESDSERSSAESSSCLLNIEWSHPLAGQLELSVLIQRRPAVVYSVVQRSTNRADSESESLYLVQYFIVRLYEIWHLLGDMASFGR